jgi:hypothetical protein
MLCVVCIQTGHHIHVVWVMEANPGHRGHASRQSQQDETAVSHDHRPVHGFPLAGRIVRGIVIVELCMLLVIELYYMYWLYEL